MIRFALLALSALLAWVAGGFLLSHPGAFGDPISDRFSLGTAGILSVSAPDLFSAESRLALQQLDKALHQSQICDAVIDLAGIPAVDTNEDDTELQPLLSLPDAKARALADPNLAGALVDRSGQATLFICTLRTLQDWPAFVHLWRAQTLPPLQLDLAGSLGISYLLGRDLMLSGTFILIVALPLMFVLAFFERRYGRQFYVWGALAFLPLIAFGSVVGFRHVRTAPAPLQVVLGGRSGQAMEGLSRIVDADMTWLVDVQGDFSHTAALQKLQAFCDKLGPQTRCPTSALKAAGRALTGSDSLPANDEQLKALAFLIGDRADLRLVFDRDRQHALVRAVDTNEEKIAAAAKAEGFTATIGGLPPINRAVRHAVPIVLGIIVLACVAAIFLGMRTGWGSVTLGGGWVAASIVTPVGVASLFLLTLGAFTLFASLGATGVTSKDIE